MAQAPSTQLGAPGLPQLGVFFATRGAVYTPVDAPLAIYFFHILVDSCDS